MCTDGDKKEGSRKILSMQLVQVSEVKNSNHLEPEGLKRCLKEVKDDGVSVGLLATDRHIMVSSIMKKEYKEINHQFDTWHVAKGIVKKLTAKAKQKDCADLTPWIQSISNHLWWSCATCEEDGQILREKWISVLHHVTNRHHWDGNTKFHRCGHATLTDTDRKEIKWLKPTSPAFRALQAVVMDKPTLKALEQLTKFCHTGELEIFHSMLLKYCPKRQHFHYEAMSARLMLAAIDWNNLKREQVIDTLGKPATSVVYSKRRKTYVLKSRYTKVHSHHMRVILHRAYEVHHRNLSLPPITRTAEVRTIGPADRPGKEELEKNSVPGLADEETISTEKLLVC